MSGLTPFFITGYAGGLQTNKKPFLLPDQAWSRLNNAYCWRERVLKREGLKFMGRLRRTFTSQSLGTTPGGQTSITFADIRATLGFPESGAQIEPGSLVITIGPADTSSFTDLGNGTFSVTGSGKAAGSFVNYDTGKVVLQFTGPLAGAAAISANINYFPGLPVMGIPSRDVSSINVQQTIWFDTTYAYIWNGTGFQEFIPGTTWASTDSDFFWAYNYRGGADNNRLFFVTNFISNAANPMRYTDGSTWTTFQPIIADNPPSAAQNLLYSARILIAYYGRLIALNTWEGTTAGGPAGAVNFFNRCRFCQYSASPVASDAWRSDQFGKGGFIDAPTNEAIIGAMFIKNTLVVTFEQSTWQLRYVGEYGLPFVWERVSADFGSESTFSSVLFDNHMLCIGDKAIIAANSISADRIDLDIPDQIFDFKNANNGVKRVFGIRNYQKEVVYWCFADAQTQAAPGVAITYPNKVLLYNYRNQTWAIFRDSVTAFGTFQASSNITWDSLTILWDSDAVTWDDVETQSQFPLIVAGNQEGFVSTYQEDYGYQLSSAIQEEPSLSISAVNLTTTPIQLTVTNHNLANLEIIYITNLNFVDSAAFTTLATDLNNEFYQVTIIDANTISIAEWDVANQTYDNNFSFTPVSSAVYVGGGLITLVPKLDIMTKDINLFQQQGLQTKLSYIDFLMAPSPNAAMTVNLFINSSLVQTSNMLIWNQPMSTVLTADFYRPGSDYSWFRFFATLAGQYFRINVTYNDNLMNTVSTHTDPWTLYAINSWVRKGGKIVF